MDQKDSFSKWLSTVEEALNGESKQIEENLECGCGNWDCEVCFPNTQGQMQMEPQVDSQVCPMCGQECMGHEEHPDGVEVEIPFDTETMNADSDMEEFPMEEEDEDEMDFHQTERPRAGKGVKLGDIIRKTEFRKAGEESPLTHGDELEEDSEESPEDMIHSIMSMQNMGLTKDNHYYSEDELYNYSPEDLKACYGRVMGEVSEAEIDMPEPPSRPTKTQKPDIDSGEIFGQDSEYLPAAQPVGDDGLHADEPGNVDLPMASKSSIQNRLSQMRPTDQMRDFMNRISPDAGNDEPELEPTTDIALRQNTDVPDLISRELKTSGMEYPEWHTVGDLPGYRDRNIRGMGKQVFGLFTRTPLEGIKTIANVNGQGPNSSSEVRSVAAWLQKNAEDLGTMDVSHGLAIPGYKPDVKEYRKDGMRFHVVRDPMGEYIYAYPDKDAVLPGGNAQDAIGGNEDMPRLGESFGLTSQISLFDQLRWDDEIFESIIEESSLSRLIGKQKGGQRLVRWLHRQHKLSNDADLQPAPFSERLLWKEYKRNPDNFIIVSAENGVAGIKPYEKHIKDRAAAMAKKNKPYDPGGDSTLPYQIIAFKDDGEQVDPELLRPRRVADDDEEGEERYADPTVMKARMGLHHGKDMQNPDNVFNLLADQIGKLRTVYVSNSAIERDKIAHRKELKGPEAGELTQDQSSADFKELYRKVSPVMKTLANQTLGQINKSATRYVNGGNFEAAQSLMTAGANLKKLIVELDKQGLQNISLADSGRHPISRALVKAIEKAAGDDINSRGFNNFLHSAANGNAMALRPILDGLRDTLIRP